MSERHQPKKPADPRVDVPEPFEHVSAPAARVLAELKKKMERRK